MQRALEGRDMNTKFKTENLKRRDNFDDFSVHERIILKWAFEMICTTGGLLQTHQWFWGFHKRLWIYWPITRL